MLTTTQYKYNIDQRYETSDDAEMSSAGSGTCGVDGEQAFLVGVGIFWNYSRPGIPDASDVSVLGDYQTPGRRVANYTGTLR